MMKNEKRKFSIEEAGEGAEEEGGGGGRGESAEKNCKNTPSQFSPA